MNEAAEKPWIVNESVERRADVGDRASHHDETPAEEDRTEEAAHLHAPARRPGTLVKQTRNRTQSESEQASSFGVRNCRSSGDK